MRLNPVFANPDGSILPASQHAVMEWVASLGARGLQPKTIKSYLTGVRSLHVDADLPFAVCESPVVQRLIRGIKRYHGERARNPKLPITLDILRRLCSSLSPTSLQDVNFQAAITLAFAGFLRCGEFTVSKESAYSPSTSLSRGSAQFLPDLATATHVVISLPASKTDPFRKGVSILVASAPGAATCPVSALRHLFQMDPQDPAVPMFLGDVPGSPLTRSSFVIRLKSLLSALGFDGAKYSGHSFRRGAATSAASVGYADHEIQQLGRWRSDAYRLYIDVSRDRILHLSTRLHWADPRTQDFEPPALPFAPPPLA